MDDANKPRPVTEISPQKLFDVIQNEYLVCVLRAKIYPIKKHSDYWFNLAQKKKEKINDLKKKYNMLSIFDDDMILKNHESKVYNDFGFPNFYYPNEKIKQQQVYWDIKNYYSIGSNVKFIDFNSSRNLKLGVVQKLIIDQCIVFVESNLSIHELSFNEVVRVFK